MSQSSQLVDRVEFHGTEFFVDSRIDLEWRGHIMPSCLFFHSLSRLSMMMDGPVYDVQELCYLLTLKVVWKMMKITLYDNIIYNASTKSGPC
jgi:hypothetical protein